MFAGYRMLVGSCYSEGSNQLLITLRYKRVTSMVEVIHLNTNYISTYLQCKHQHFGKWWDPNIYEYQPLCLPKGLLFTGPRILWYFLIISIISTQITYIYLSWIIRHGNKQLRALPLHVALKLWMYNKGLQNNYCMGTELNEPNTGPLSLAVPFGLSHPSDTVSVR